MTFLGPDHGKETVEPGSLRCDSTRAAELDPAVPRRRENLRSAPGRVASSRKVAVSSRPVLNIRPQRRRSTGLVAVGRHAVHTLDVGIGPDPHVQWASLDHADARMLSSGSSWRTPIPNVRSRRRISSSRFPRKSLSARGREGIVQLAGQEPGGGGLRRRRIEDRFDLRVAHVVQQRSTVDDQVALDTETGRASQEEPAEPGGLRYVVDGSQSTGHDATATSAKKARVPRRLALTLRPPPSGSTSGIDDARTRST